MKRRIALLVISERAVKKHRIGCLLTCCMMLMKMEMEFSGLPLMGRACTGGTATKRPVDRMSPNLPNSTLQMACRPTFCTESKVMIMATFGSVRITAWPGLISEILKPLHTPRAMEYRIMNSTGHLLLKQKTEDYFSAD